MPKYTFAANGEWNAGMDAKSEAGYCVLNYTGSLGGGTLRVYTEIEGVKSQVPNSKLTAATADAATDIIQQFVIHSAGNIYVQLSGATAPNVTVAIK